VNSSEFIGKNMLELEKEGRISESVTLKVLKSRKTETISLGTRTGKEVLATGNPIFNDKNEVIMVLTNLRDMTDLNKMSRELDQSKEMTSEYKKRLQELQRSSLSDNVVAVSSAMKDVCQIVRRVSGTDATVFMHGETGVGKDIIAEEIHQLSERSKTGVMVKINCGSIPETLIESELFGYAKGAFTGAVKGGKPGLFEIADGGTLFLDEIDSMPLVLQSKLLRVLQNFEIRRLGSTTSRVVNVRLICASNQEMNELLLKKQFRSDLYYRLNVIPIHIPPLRERPEAIPYLVQAFMKRFNQKHAMEKTMSKNCCEMLARYPWPGNVRELANVIERLIVLSPDDCIMTDDLPKELLGKSGGGNGGGFCASLKEQLKNIETKIITDAIEKYGNARRAAMHLNVNPSTICRKLHGKAAAPR
jgi:transcriptional regulator with PAS, ATPase and Fis domain